MYIKPLKSEAIHETGLSGNVVTSFFSSHNIYIYIYIYIYIFFFIILYKLSIPTTHFSVQSGK